MYFYEVLQKIMDEREMNIPDLARATGLSDSTIRSILTRKSKGVALDVAAKISKGLNVSLEELNGDIDGAYHKLDNDGFEKKGISGEMSVNFKGKLEKHMHEAGITRAELARATKIPYTTIDSILKRDEIDMIKLPVVQAIADYFSVCLDYLLRDEINDPNYGIVVNKSRESAKSLAIYATDEDSDIVEQLDNEQIAEYLNELTSLPKDALGELRTILDYLKFKYKEDNSNG